MSRILKDVGFVHLHVHSSYSLLEGAMRIDDLKKLALKDRMPALALTDTNNLFGALEFSEKMAGAGIQPITGIDLAVEMGDDRAPGRSPHISTKRPTLVLLAASAEGYANLMRLGSQAYMATEPGEDPHLRIDEVLATSGGLIALTGGPDGPIDRALDLGQADLAEERLKKLKAAFGDRLYIELQRHGLNSERRTEASLIDLAYRLDIPLVATNEPYFSKGEDYGAHDALLAIAEGRVVNDDQRRRVSPEHDFKTRRQMMDLFADIPEAITNTVEIAMRCAYRPRTQKPMLPRFTVGEGDAVDEAAALADMARTGLEQRLAFHGPAPGLTEDDYRKRLDFELSIIERMKFPGYFLIVADFIQWAKAQDIPVGPGRGSGAGSLVAYATTITDLDPLRFSLLFERFLNPERVSMPDFDIDFCQDRRDEVIRYVQKKYGTDRVAQIITFGTLQARGVMRDVGRVLQMPYGQVDKLTKLVPQNPANPVTLDQAIAVEPKLRAAADEDPVVGRMLDIARTLEGLHRHASTHAAGIVIADRPLDQIVPLYRDPKSDMPVTQFNMKWVEPAGLVKFDFLGLKTLTVIQMAIRLVKKARNIDVDIAAIPIDDKPTFEMLGRGETVGVFQVESPGMRKALAEMKADRFEDIIALVALYRPGPMANIPVYCARKLGQEQAEYLHPKLEASLSETHGVIIYQEQVMQIAQLLSGYSLGEADLLRRAMGKKIKSEMDAQRERFVTGAVERGVDQDTSNTIFDLLAKFADYGFNKSHAAAYALVAYQTAYLKANFATEFLAASMTLDMSNTDKLSEFRREAQRLGIRVEPPSLNRSGVEFDVHVEADGTQTIRYALAAIKGVGRQAVESVVAARKDGPFKDLGDLARRINPRLLNKRTLEGLIAAGALDQIEPDRARASAAVDGIMATANRATDESAAGQGDIFGGLGAPEPLRVPPYKPWQSTERLQREYDAIGFFLTGHPLDEYQSVINRLRIQKFSEFSRSVRQGASTGRVAATILDRQERRTKSGNKMGILALSDQSGHFEAIIFQEGLNQFRDELEPGRAVILVLEARLEADEVRARIQSVEPIDQVAAKLPASLRVFLRNDGPIASVAERLKDRGDGEVSIIVMLDDGMREVEVKLPGGYRATPQIAGAIKAVPGVVSVELS